MQQTRQVKALKKEIEQLEKSVKEYSDMLEKAIAERNAERAQYQKACERIGNDYVNLEPKEIRDVSVDILPIQRTLGVKNLRSMSVLEAKKLGFSLQHITEIG